MRVAVDATMIKDGQAGLRTVATGLVKALAELPGLSVGVLTLSDDSSDWGGANQVACSLSSGNPQIRQVWREARLPALVRGLGSDILLVLNPESLRRCPIPQVIMFHDLGPLMAPAYYGVSRYVRYLATVGGACKRASRVVCVSRTTKLDLIRWTGIDPNGVDVIGNAPQVLARQGENLRRPRVEGDGYVLYVGAALPHKNLATLVRAFEGDGLDGLKLVMCGPDYAGEVGRLMKGTSSEAAVHKGFVSRGELLELYRGASAFAFPSLYEGFGLPLLEAFQFDLPVVASDIPAVRETGGRWAEYVSDPLDVDEWRAKLGRAAAVGLTAGSSLDSGRVAYGRSTSWGDVARRVEKCLWKALEPAGSAVLRRSDG